ncbi:MAG: hypothetical protein HAW61_02450 [Candidatus Portiera sp.]|nr:hypothetical protein [Portiera sp.]
MKIINKRLGWAVFWVVVFIMVAAILSKNDSEYDSKEELTPLERYKKCLAGGDGKHRNLEKMIKKGMLDPSSYRLIKNEAYVDFTAYIRYAALSRNGLTVIKEITVQSDPDCNILRIIKER